MASLRVRRPKPGEDGEHPTYCRICEPLCGMVATVKDGEIVDVGPDRANPHSKGHICVKGPAFRDITYDPDRVLHPLKRVGAPGEFVRVSWDEALDDIAKRLRAVLDAHGGDAFACYLGNPSAFSWSHFFYAKGFVDAAGSHKFYTAASQDTSSRSVASYWLYGEPLAFPIPDLPRADFVLILGANPLVSHGSLITDPRMREHLNAAHKRGRVVVVDPRRTETAKVYEHVPIMPDTDVYLIGAMLRVLADEGRCDERYLSETTTGAQQLREALAFFDIADCAERTGISEARIRELVRSFAAAEHAAVYARVGICRGTFATLGNFLLDAMSILTGKFGRPGCNSFGYAPIDFGETAAQFGMAGVGLHRSRVGGLPSVGGHMPATMLPHDIEHEGEGRVRALMVTSGNPVLSAPGGAALEAAFSKLDLMFSLDLYVTETNKHADYVLPVTGFFERADLQIANMAHMVRPYVQFTEAVIPPRGEARIEHDILMDLAKRLGVGGPFSLPWMRFVSRLGIRITPELLFGAGLRTSDVGDMFGLKAGHSVESLRDQHPHGVMLEGRFPVADWRKKISHPEQRISLWNADIASEFERLRTARPKSGLCLFGRRHLKSINSWMHNSEKMLRGNAPSLFMHPDDAAARQIRAGQSVRVASRAGAMTVRVEITDEIVRGSVCYPHGWSHDGGWKRANSAEGGNVNLLASIAPEDQEQVSGMALLDGIIVDVTPIEEALTA